MIWDMIESEEKPYSKSEVIRGVSDMSRRHALRGALAIGGAIALSALLFFSAGKPPPKAIPLPEHWISANIDSFTYVGETATLNANNETLVFFWAPWCESCVDFRDRVLTDPEIGVIVGDYELKYKDPILSWLNFKTIPTAILFDADGKEVHRWEAGVKFTFTPEIEHQLLDELKAELDKLRKE